MTRSGPTRWAEVMARPRYCWAGITASAATLIVLSVVLLVPPPVSALGRSYDSAEYVYDDESKLVVPARAAAVARPDSDQSVAQTEKASNSGILRLSFDLVAPNTRLVPGGGLAAHELAGGHTLARHIGLSADDLAARLASQPNIPAASTFGNRATAEASIASALNANEAAIQAWLRGVGGNAGSAFTTSLADPIGSTLIRGATGPTSASTVRVVLRPDASMPGGFRILTAFPE